MSTYEVADDQMAAGSTLGAPKAVVVVKATGAIEKFYSIDAGQTLVGTVVLHHWGERTGIPLPPLPGRFVLHPHHQEHAQFAFTLAFSMQGRSSAERVYRSCPPAAKAIERLDLSGGSPSVSPRLAADCVIELRQEA